MPGGSVALLQLISHIQEARWKYKQPIGSIVLGFHADFHVTQVTFMHRVLSTGGHPVLHYQSAR